MLNNTKMAQTRNGSIKIFCNKHNISVDFYNLQINQGLKWCYKCKDWKNSQCFNVDNSRFDGKTAKCQECTRSKNKIILPKLTYKLAETTALLYINKVEFCKKDQRIYKYACKEKIIDNICSHMECNIKWTYEKVYISALICKNMQELRQRYPGAVDYAIRHNILDEITSHIEKKHRWNFDSVHQVALLCKGRYEFQLRFKGAYAHAIENDFLEQVCSHMEVVGGFARRKIYEIRFNEIESCYIGLSYDTKARKASHEKESSNKFVKELIKSGCVYEWIEDNEWSSYEIIGEMERNRIKQRKLEGWNVLNIAKGGALGMAVSKWNHNNTKSVALLCKTKSEFRKKYIGAVNYAIKHKIFEEITSHMPKQMKYSQMIKEKKNNIKLLIKWDFEEVWQVALLCKNRNEFRLRFKGAYAHATDNGFLEQVCSHMSTQNKWGDDNAQNSALKFETKDAFRVGAPGAYGYCQKKGILKIVCAHMPIRAKRSCYRKIKNRSLVFK